ncbi:MAG TPA: cytochrome c peroxidase [Stellaceae bacterium]|nr:cytochrome c peroxidase [Stellaceae bacterium]
MLRALALLLLALSAAVPAVAGQANPDPRRPEWKQLYERPEDVPFPSTDGYSDEKAALGRMLFFDPILSGNGIKSCASCHNPSLSWGDGLARSLGAGEKPMPTRAPTLIDIAWIPVLGWDGRFPDLESVPFDGPITSPTIMDRSEKDLVAILRANPGYRHAFAEAFGERPISRATISEALATFERGIVAEEAPFDRWIGGDDRAISDEAKHGFDLFNGKAGCAECHKGWNFTDGAFYDIGTATGEDIGRGRLFRNSTKLQYAFKVPTLRDIARRAPYMHDGSEATLEDVVELYNRGGIERPSRSELIKPLGLSGEDKAALVAFLKTLTGAPAALSLPRLPR